MASSATFTTLVLSSSFVTRCNISNHHYQNYFLFPPPKSPLFSISKPHSLKLTSTFLLPKTLTFSTIPKSSEYDAAVVNVEPDNVDPEPESESEVEAVVESETEPESAQVVEASEEKPKREEIFAVVMIGGRQYIVFPGRYLYTQRLKGANVNDKKHAWLCMIFWSQFGDGRKGNNQKLYRVIGINLGFNYYGDLMK
ncbi:Detected protein of confused Function [Hibiscus syriacus]|uniref:Detected protein of confused Function n=1 Tax=Hibiscus syriacus TaxID=106335 RepID=A0A6A2Y096_HIBSY|nr:Detected protein of confused Function [Hibiscus syriacus]